MKRGMLRLWNWIDLRFLFPVEVPKMSFDVIEAPDGNVYFLIDDLKVWLYKGDYYWVAQGLDIGYVATGAESEDAKSNFAKGLHETLRINWEHKGNVQSVLRPAPPEVWAEWRYSIRHCVKCEESLVQDKTEQPRLFESSRIGPKYFTPAHA